MKRLITSAAGAVLALPVLVMAAPAFADSPGQLTTGANTFVVKNITQNGAYANSASAACNEQVQYSVRLHNAAYGGLTKVVVKVNLANGQMTAVPAEGASQGTNGTATVTVPSNGTLSYVTGSTVLYSAAGTAIKTLPDGVTAAGVNAGDIAGSTTEFVNFKAKVNCPTPPAPSYKCEALKVTQVSRTKFTFTATASAANGATISKYTFDFGDGVKVDSTTNTVTHEYAKDGSYEVSVTVSVMVNGSIVQSTSKECKAGVTVKPETPVTPTPTPTPTQPLPDTGAGDVLSVFAGVSAAGAATHYAVRRRLNK